MLFKFLKISTFSLTIRIINDNVLRNFRYKWRNLNDSLLRLRVMQNTLQLTFFFHVLIPSAVFGHTGKVFKVRSVCCSCRHVWPKIGSPSLDTLASYSIYVLKFSLCDHSMPSALEINGNGGNGGSEQEHVESCPLTTTHIIYPLPTILMASKLGRVVTYHEGLPPKKNFWPSDHVVFGHHVTN